MKEIQLTKGYVALVDDQDYDDLSQFKWCVCVNKNGKPYAMRRAYGAHGSYRPTIYMHRYIMRVKDSAVLIDHIDMNGLNNQRYNLRLCSDSQNKCNKISHSGSSSKFKGVRRIKETGNWAARITYKGKKIGLGTYRDENQAAIAYNGAARVLHGDFARLNVVKQT